jgi:Na+/H+-translocating membrane pyrophosphatase
LKSVKQRRRRRHLQVNWPTVALVAVVLASIVVSAALGVAKEVVYIIGAIGSLGAGALGPYMREADEENSAEDHEVD